MVFSRPACWDLLRFGIPFVGTQIATFVMTFGDRYVLKVATDLTTVGIYALGYQFGFLLATLAYAPFNTVWEPARFEIAKRPDRDEMYSRAFVYFNVFQFFVAVVIALFVSDLLRIMAAPAFHGASTVVPVILVAYVLQAWTGFHNLGVFIKERTGLITLANWIAMGVAVVGYLVLIPRLFAMGAAIATVAAFGTRELLVYRMAQRLWPVRYKWTPVWLNAIIAATVVVMGLLMPAMVVWRSVFFRCLLVIVYVGAVWHLGVLTTKDKTTIRAKIHQLRAAVLARSAFGAGN